MSLQIYTTADVIDFDAVEKELKNGLKLLNMVAEDLKLQKENN